MLKGMVQDGDDSFALMSIIVSTWKVMDHISAILENEYWRVPSTKCSYFCGDISEENHGIFFFTSRFFRKQFFMLLRHQEWSYSLFNVSKISVSVGKVIFHINFSLLKWLIFAPSLVLQWYLKDLWRCDGVSCICSVVWNVLFPEFILSSLWMNNFPRCFFISLQYFAIFTAIRCFLSLGSTTLDSKRVGVPPPLYRQRGEIRKTDGVKVVKGTVISVRTQINKVLLLPRVRSYCSFWIKHSPYSWSATSERPKAPNFYYSALRIIVENLQDSWKLNLAGKHGKIDFGALFLKILVDNVLLLYWSSIRQISK